MAKGAIRALQTELRELSKNPVEGFTVKLADGDNLFKWEVGIFGPPTTLYEGGYFRAILTFPEDYPYSPPSMKFITKMFHPNIYENGEVCISILHSPGEDPISGELPSERWNPTQNVRTILLSVISMLNEPNIQSAAYVDASVSYRKWRDSKGVDADYANIVRKLTKQTHADAIRCGVKVPTTLEEYCFSGRSTSVNDGSKAGADGHRSARRNSDDGLVDEDCFMDDYDDDYYRDDEDDDEDEEGSSEDVKEAKKTPAISPPPAPANSNGRKATSENPSTPQRPTASASSHHSKTTSTTTSSSAAHSRRS